MSTTQAHVLDRQAPLGTGLSATTTADDVIEGISLAGKTAVVTGGYSGLGKETVRVLRHAGAEVIVPARDVDRAAKAMDGIDARIEHMDLLDPASIDAFVDRFLSESTPLDILINSAGIMAVPFAHDARGYELQFATNHLGHFQLTLGLLPALRKADGARMVSVSSWGHHFSPVRFDDLHFKTGAYDPWASYGQSKTANILFALEFDERYQAEGIRAFSIHPGGILETNLGRHLDLEQFRALDIIDDQGNPILDPSRNLKNVQQGASTQVWCATSPTLNGMGGVYCENCDVAQLESAEHATGFSFTRLEKHDGLLPYAVDLDAAKRLWEVSEQLLAGVRA